MGIYLELDADLLKPVEGEDLKASNVEDADEYSFFLRRQKIVLESHLSAFFWGGGVLD